MKKDQTLVLDIVNEPTMVDIINEPTVDEMREFLREFHPDMLDEYDRQPTERVKRVWRVLKVTRG